MRTPRCCWGGGWGLGGGPSLLPTRGVLLRTPFVGRVEASSGGRVGWVEGRRLGETEWFENFVSGL